MQGDQPIEHRLHDQEYRLLLKFKNIIKFLNLSTHFDPIHTGSDLLLITRKTEILVPYEFIEKNTLISVFLNMSSRDNSFSNIFCTQIL